MTLKYWLLFLLYFVQGIPYGLQSGLLPVYFRTAGLSFTKISLTKLLYLPWILKVLWAPFVDWYLSKKTWLMLTMCGLAMTCLACSFLTPEVDFLGVAVTLLLMNLFASIQDVATDGVAIQLLGAEEVGFGNSIQVVAYKLGSLLAGGGLLTFLHHLGWGALFVYLALIYAAAIVFTSRFHLSSSTQDRPAKDRDLTVLRFFHEILLVPDTLWTAGFVLIYKLGEQGSVSMFPLFLLDHSFSPQKLGFWNGIVATAFSITGSSLGGHLVSDSRNSESLQILLVLRFCNLLFQTWVMVTYTDQAAAFQVAAVLSLCIQHFIGGLITTLVFSKMMLCSQKAPERIQATHYSFLAAIEVLGKVAFSTVAGSLVDWLGFRHTFGIFLAFSFASVLYTV
ncbi:major facilitator superfamily domain-containing protein 3 [Crotalus tigris]|uniref:major facilitator superfamily domain-containing protein 3 n=1 Tax=Crotalus tigris TaxID=88082 RepID=UPI00192F149E|nr:major facilitator superfamily domain-containing protein 3 [Crotalus tigris]